MTFLSLSELHILLVEPSTMQRKVIVNNLHKMDISTIDQATGYKTAMSALERTKPDLIISSLYFEDGSAHDLLRYIHNHSECIDIPFMLISSETRREELEAFKQAGVIAILPKPFSHEHLQRALKATIDTLSDKELDLELYDVSTIRVLVVDDSRMARKAICKVLTNLGMNHLSQAADGAKAIELLRSESFDLVVTDYNMPEVNGLELTEFIRHSELHSHLPIMMVTSEANDAHLSHIAQAGVDAISDKPFEPETVRRLLINILGSA